MPDTALNIQTVVNTAPVTNLRQAVKQLRDEYNGLSADQRTGPIGQKMAADINQLNAAVKQANPNFAAMSQKVREARSEHRLLAFGMLSVVHAMDGLIGKNEEFNKSLEGTVNTTMGLQFGLSMIKGPIGELAFPIAATVSSISTIMNAMDSLTRSAQEIQKRFNDIQKENQSYQSTVRGVEVSKIIATTPNEFERNAKLLGAYKSELQDALGVYENYARTNREYTKEGLQAQKDYYDALKKVNDQQKLMLAFDTEIANERRASHAAVSQELSRFRLSSGFGLRPGQRTRRRQISDEMIQQEDRSSAADLADYLAMQGLDRQTTIAGATVSRGLYESDQSFADRQQTVLDIAIRKTQEMNKTTEMIAHSFDRVGTSIEQNLIAKLNTGKGLAGQLVSELLTSAVSLIGSVASGGAGAGLGGMYLALIGAGKSRNSGN